MLLQGIASHYLFIRSPNMALLVSSHVSCTHPMLKNNNNKTNSNLQSNTLLRRGSCYGTKKAYNNSSLIVKCRVKAVATVANEQKQVVLIDGLEPATYTPPKDLKRSDFPADFIFGASTSALQTEGRGDEGGRGKSTWDFMIKAQEGKMAVDSYHLYKEDVKLLKEMGMNAYRFSIAWPRILPKGTVEGGINQEGIDFYNNFLQELLDNGITPVVTLFHFDMPVDIAKNFYGFMRSDVVEHFKNFADICFKEFGDKVKYWSTINEPFVFGAYGYKMGLPKEVSNDPLGPYIATHNIILSHAAATRHYKQHYQKSQKGKIGICLPCKWYTPHDSTDPKDFSATKVQLDYMLGWYMEPLYTGEYPGWMRQCIKGLPEFTAEEKKMVQGAYDYIGINYYTSRYGKQTCTVDAINGVIKIEFTEHTEDVKGNKIGWQARGQEDIYVHPDGLKNLLLYVKETYGDPELYVTENGVPDKPTVSASVPDLIAQGKKDELKTLFNDQYRCEHAEDHLTAVREAMKEGADVKGYFVWSLMDNMEVGAGYETRFGLNFVDYFDNHKRYPKLSAKWFTEFLKEDPEAEDEHKKKKKKFKILPF